jgi:hypothetical protein
MDQLFQIWQRVKPATSSASIDVGIASGPPETHTCTCTCDSDIGPTCKDSDTQTNSIPWKEAKDASVLSYSLFLKLPVELRLQIYSYLDLDGHVISVLSKPISTLHTAEEILWYRIESQEPTDTKITHQPRYAHLGCLFAISSVCQQLRSEIIPMIYANNAFLFTDALYSYAISLPLFITSLTPSYLHSIKTIYWPLRQARDIQRFGIGNLEPPDRSCMEELRSLTGLKKVVLGFVVSDVGAARMRESEIREMGVLGIGTPGMVDYAGERSFRRELAVRGMREVLGGSGGEVEIGCERRMKW